MKTFCYVGWPKFASPKAVAISFTGTACNGSASSTLGWTGHHHNNHCFENQQQDQLFTIGRGTTFRGFWWHMSCSVPMKMPCHGIKTSYDHWLAAAFALALAFAFPLALALGSAPPSPPLVLSFLASARISLSGWWEVGQDVG